MFVTGCRICVLRLHSFWFGILGFQIQWMSVKMKTVLLPSYSARGKTETLSKLGGNEQKQDAVEVHFNKNVWAIGEKD
jgi:hypothetical protein